MGLSSACIREDNVKKAGKYIRKKGRPPKLHAKIATRATKLVNESQPPDPFNSVELSASFFDMDELVESESSEEVIDVVVVHTIGKPADGEFIPLSKDPNYLKNTWTVGIDISEEDVARQADDEGEIYIWYRWFQEAWQPKFVTKEEFEQLRSFGS